MNLIPYEAGKTKFGFGPVPVLLSTGAGPVSSPSRWATEQEQSALLRATGWPARFTVRPEQ